MINTFVGSNVPNRILITGGREVGGVNSFAEGLAKGFLSLGLPADVVSPGWAVSHWRDMRDPKLLKILSTSAVYAAPIARRSICMAHGTTRAYLLGFKKMAAVVASFKLANACSGTQLVAVSHYVATHLQTIFNIRIDGVIRNPLRSVFLDPPNLSEKRSYITYVGRLDPVKNLHLLLPPIFDILREMPNIEVCIIGDGVQRRKLQEYAGGNPRVKFLGTQDAYSVRQWLRKSKVFISGTPTEALGISYLEALSQGCAVVMPACGGGLEIALKQIGKSVFLMPLSFARTEIVATLRNALSTTFEPLSMRQYAADIAAKSFLKLDSRFTLDGRFIACRQTEHGDVV